MRAKSRKVKKKPISSSSSLNVSAPTVSRKLTQATITSFHTLLKQRASLKRRLANAPTAEERRTVQSELNDLAHQIEALGGLDAYQKASTLGQSKERGGDSSRVFVAWLSDMGLLQEGGLRSRMLEIGALRPDNYLREKLIDNFPIDLNSQHPEIVEQDFFERPIPISPEQKFDFISCSLVLNFVDEPAKRGQMLQLIHDHLKPNGRSLMFLVLPLPCLTNSRYLTVDVLTALMKDIGFQLVRERWKEGGKVGYWLWRWQEQAAEVDQDTKWCKKVMIHDGPKRNNFAVLLPRKCTTSIVSDLAKK